MWFKVFIYWVSSGVPFSQLHYGTIASRGMRQSRIFQKEQCCFEAMDELPGSDCFLLDCFSFILCSYEIYAQCFQSYLIIALPQASQYPATLGITVGKNLMLCLCRAGIRRRLELWVMLKGKPTCVRDCIGNCCVPCVASPMEIG